MIYNRDTYYFQKDVLGSVQYIKNSAGKIVATYTYDAYGNSTVTNALGYTIGYINPFRYRGYYCDTETGFYYLQSRYYDTSIMRFINADDYELISTLASTIGQLNLYAYCNDNPIMYTDESGTLIWELALIGFIIGAATGAVDAIYRGDNILVGILIGGLLGGIISGTGAGFLLSAFLSGTGSALIDILNGRDINWMQVGISALVGGVFAKGLGVIDNFYAKIGDLFLRNASAAVFGLNMGFLQLATNMIINPSSNSQYIANNEIKTLYEVSYGRE